MKIHTLNHTSSNKIPYIKLYINQLKYHTSFYPSTKPNTIHQIMHQPVKIPYIRLYINYCKYHTSNYASTIEIPYIRLYIK